MAPTWSSSAARSTSLSLLERMHTSELSYAAATSEAFTTAGTARRIDHPSYRTNESITFLQEQMNRSPSYRNKWPKSQWILLHAPQSVDMAFGRNVVDVRRNHEAGPDAFPRSWEAWPGLGRRLRVVSDVGE